MSVALADQPGVEVLAIQVDVAKQATVAVSGIAGSISSESNRSAFEMSLAAGLLRGRSSWPSSWS